MRIRSGALLRLASSTARRPSLEEVKVKLDGTHQCFDLELWRREPRVVVVGKWTAPDPNAYGVPPASTSWGVWPMVAGQRWGAYRIHTPDGTLLKYRFDALENPRAIDAIDGD